MKTGLFHLSNRKLFLLRIAKLQSKTLLLIRETSDGADSSLRRSKASTSGSKSSLSLGTVDDDSGHISDEFDTTAKENRKKATSETSKTTSKKTTGSRQKAEETISRRDEARATAWLSSLFGGNEKYPQASK